MNDWTSPVDIRPDHLEIVQDILRAHLPAGFNVWVFGSRANWTTKDSSDLDLAVEAADRLGHRDMVELEVAFEESDLPYTVDVVDLNAVSPEFKEIVEGQRILLPPTAGRATAGRDWREMPFSQAVQINPTVRFERGGIYPFVDMASVNADSRSATSAEEREFKGSGSRFQDGDTLMARITPCLENGKIARYQAKGDKPEAHGSTEFIVIRGRPDVTDNDFAYYLTQWEEVRNYAIGRMTGTSGRQRVPVDSLDHLTVPLPPLPEQRAIAHILGTLDDKIELNRRMNETLEAMARAVFQDWFLDFGPVRAKLEGREPYLPSEPWDLFPDCLVDSKWGEVPEGWEVRTLRELSNLNPESWSKTNSPANVEYVDLANTKWGVIESTQLFSWKDAPSRAKRVLRPGDTIVGTVRPGNGSYSLIGEDGLTGSTGFAVLRPLNPRFRELVYLAATASDNIEWLAHRADGAAYPAVRPEIVAETQITIPATEADLLNWFSKSVGSILNKMESTKMESRSLDAQRNALLPMLVSGELWVSGSGRLPSLRAS